VVLSFISELIERGGEGTVKRPLSINSLLKKKIEDDEDEDEDEVN